jgi:Xaa-Pro aminopeptidase
MRSTGLRTAALALLLAACAPGAATVPPPTPPAPAVEARTDWTMPALAAPTPIAASEYAARRRALSDGLRDGVFVAFGTPAPAADYLPYEQEPNFRFLTGLTEPSAALVIVRSGGRAQEHLFVQPRDPAREVWEGARLGTEGARALTGMPARTIAELPAFLGELAGMHSVFYALTRVPDEPALGDELTYAQQVLARLRAARPTLRLENVAPLVGQLRARKSPAELDRIRRAVYISTLAHREAMRAAGPGMNEFEIRALLEYFFLRFGADGPAYSSIVGSGPNATTLHYRDADRFMNAGEVLLIDAAASYDGYAADVTRTFPVDGTFSPEQRAIYEVVLAAQKAAESQIRHGATWAQLNQAANDSLATGLARLGLIEAPTATYDCQAAGGVRECPQYRIWYMHGLGHGVGLAVHDPDISHVAGFQPGSAVTIEPGIYIRRDALDHLPDTPRNREILSRLRPVAQRYFDIGVRIEDVYIFDENGVDRVSRGVPREIDEIEALMREPGIDAATRRGDVVEWYRGLRPR